MNRKKEKDLEKMHRKFRKEGERERERKFAQNYGTGKKKLLPLFNGQCPAILRSRKHFSVAVQNER